MFPRRAPNGVLFLGMLAVFGLVSLVLTSLPVPPAHAQACPPYCLTPVITPAWHMHMCDMSYQEQQSDNHCMRGKGVTEFPAGTDRVYIIYCHKYTDTVGIQIKDANGGLQYVNHPDGITYSGVGCESLVFTHRNGIPSAGSPFFTSAWWPEGPFTGIGAGIEWYIGLFVAFDQDNYYGNAAQALITARDPAASTDPAVVETIAVQVTSTSDPIGITVNLSEENSGSSLFRAARPLGFSTTGSSQANGVIKVNNRDVVTVSYCPRNCTAPYIDTATWYQIVATITPTPLPTWGGPAPTQTPTPQPGERIAYLTLRPAPADVGYVPQVSTQKDRPNHLGYPGIYSGMWTRGTNLHLGMVQFNLGSVPAGAQFTDARVEMVGRDKSLTKPGDWALKLLAGDIDEGWRNASFDAVRTAGVLAQIGPSLSETEIGAGRRNTFGFTREQIGLLQDRLATSKRASFRVDGPTNEEQSLFAWESGVDVYNRETKPPDPALGPALFLTYRLSGAEPSPTTSGQSSPTPPGASSPTPRTSATVTPTGPTQTPRPATASPTPIVPVPITLTPTPPGGVATPSASPTASPTASAIASALPSATTSNQPTATPGAFRTMSPTSTTSPIGPTSSTTPTAPIAPTATRTPGALTPTATKAMTPVDGPEARQVCLLAFIDRDADGLRGPAERLLAGVTVRLVHLRTGVFISWTTDGTNLPDTCWNGLGDGDYTLSISRLPLGYVASGPTEYRITVPIGQVVSQYEFGARIPEEIPPTLQPTPSPVPTVTARPSPTSIATPTNTPEPTVVGPSGEICLGVFRDKNRDGTRDPAEGWLAGVRLLVLNDRGATARELRSVADGPICTRLATGAYYARAELPPGAIATTGQQGILLTQDAHQSVEFGQYRPDAAYLPLTLLKKTGRFRGTH